jgi:hypothetical protein
VLQATSTASVSDGQWHHVAMVLDATAQTLSIWIDGAQDGVVAVPAEDFTGILDGDNELDPISIGFQLEAGGGGYLNSFLGSLDEVALYDRALTAAELGDLATGRGKCLLP